MFAFVAFTSAASWMFDQMPVRHHDLSESKEGEGNDC